MKTHFPVWSSAIEVGIPEIDAQHRELFELAASFRGNGDEIRVMKSLVITDSIEASASVKAAKNIRIVPTAPMFAQAILNTWHGTSVSSLFETDTLVPIYEGIYQRS